MLVIKLINPTPIEEITKKVHVNQIFFLFFVVENDAFSTNYLCKLQNRLKIKIT